MEKRKFKKLNGVTSLLGFGCMRFPTLPSGKIDSAKVAEMFDYAYKHGVNYYDTAYPYHSGESELIVGEVLKKYPRESFYLTTKLPVWLVNTTDDISKFFDEQRKKLQVEYLDFYLLHALNKEKYVKVRDLGVLPILKKYKEEGKIKNIGFSFHSSLEDFEYILNDGLEYWDFCQIQLNYIDLDFQQGQRGYDLLKEHDIPVIIMEPLKGGNLATLPADIAKPLLDYSPKASIASWGFRFIASYSQVTVVLSGMGSMDQVKDNIATFTNFKPVNAKELELIDEVAVKLKKRTYVPCTGCDYCLGCPKDIKISKTFKVANSLYKFDKLKDFVNSSDLKDTNYKNCIKCKACEKKCPQGIKITEVLQSLKNLG